MSENKQGRQFTSSIKSCQYYKEKKNRQFTALFKVSAFEAFQKIAYMKQVSTNFLLGEAIQQR